MNKNTSLFVEGYGKIPKLEKNYNDYVEQCIIIYGESGTGKTVIIKEILHLTNGHIPNVIVVSPTEEQNQSYKGIIHPACILEDISVEKLSLLYDRQKEAKKIYNIANDMEILKSLFLLVADNKERELYQKLKCKINNKIYKIKKKINDPEKKSEMVNEIKKYKEKATKYLFKKVIKINKEVILKNQNISKEKKIAATYLNFNHRILLIFDDYSSSAKKWGKDETVAKILFQGRHVGITFIVAIHNQTLLNTDIRTNAHLSFFTSPASSNRYFIASGKTNGFSTSDRKNIEQIIKKIWDGKNNKNYKKLVYTKKSNYMFQYTIADMYKNFKFGSKYVNRYLDYISKKKDEEEFHSNLFDIKI